MTIHKQGGVDLCCHLMRCSLWPLAARLGCILVTVLAESNRRAKLSFMHAGAHRLLQQHLMIGHHDVRPAAKQALELLSETLKPVVSGDDEDDKYGDALWGKDVALTLSDLDMEAFLAGWSNGSTTLNYDKEYRTYEEDISRVDTHVPVGECAGWKERWTARASGVKKPAYS